MKKEIRILGIDDMPFPFNDEKTGIVGVVMRGGTYLEGVLKSEVEIDGRDASDAIINMVKNSRHAGQLKIIMVDGVALGGFNVIDGEKIYNETNLPVITVTREKPNMRKMEEALKKHFDDWKERLEIINKGEMHEIKLGYTIYSKFFGIDEKEGKEIIKLATIRGAIPEPVRVAHLIATGIKKGESKGRC